MSSLQIGNDSRGSVLPVKPASGPGFLGPKYSPADEMLPPASIGVRRGGGLDDVIGAVKGVIYYGDMIGFGESSSAFTRGMPGLRPLGVNYFINSGLQCSNGATMWEYVQTIPTGNALGEKVKQAIRGVGLPQLRGMAPGILEDAVSALNPAPVINAMVGSGYPQCRLVRMPVGDSTGKITNVDGNLLVDPAGLIAEKDGKSYTQEHWIQDREAQPVRRDGETANEQYMRGNPIQLDYENWNLAPKLYRDDGCLKDRKSNPSMAEPLFCKGVGNQIITLPDGSQISAAFEGFQNMSSHSLPQMKPTGPVSISVAAIAIVLLLGYRAFS